MPGKGKQLPKRHDTRASRRFQEEQEHQISHTTLQEDIARKRDYVLDQMGDKAPVSPQTQPQIPGGSFEVSPFDPNIPVVNFNRDTEDAVDQEIMLRELGGLNLCKQIYDKDHEIEEQKEAISTLKRTMNSLVESFRNEMNGLRNANSDLQRQVLMQGREIDRLTKKMRRREYEPTVDSSDSEVIDVIDLTE